MATETQKEAIELLIRRMSVRTPILVIGAGFSCGVLNGQGKPLPTGKDLAKELTDEILEKLPAASTQYLQDYRQDREDLKKTCDNIREENRVEKRNKYITQRMRGCHCAPDDYHMLLKDIPWKHIFSLNVDDLVEYIYGTLPVQKRPNVHVMGKSYIESRAELELYKLHGSVGNPAMGYVFDSQEYREYITEASWALERFGQLFLTNDVIFLGTEFQEEDLLLLIEKYMKMVDIREPFHQFFVSPNINNRRLSRKIEGTSYMHHIQLDVRRFFAQMKNRITDVEDLRRKMRDYGMIFYDEKQEEAISNPQYGSELYLGLPPRPIDFFQNVDIIRPTLKGKAKSISERGGNQLIILHGMPYVGKTCAALRLGVDLMGFGYTFSVFNLPVSMDAKIYEELLLEYLSRLPEGAKIAVLAEEMPYYYSRVKKIMKRCPTNVESFIFICTAYTVDHESKKYLLDECKTLEEVPITEKTREGRMAEAIYDKLKEKNHLNKLRGFGDTERECVKFIKKTDDIIDVLYIAQEGRGFVAHFTEWVDKHSAGEEQEAFLYLNILLHLGIPAIPRTIFLNLLIRCGIKTEMRAFLNDYSDTVQLEEDNLRLRCSRLLWDSIQGQIDKDNMIRKLVESIKYLAKNLREGDETLENTMFQKLIKTNNLHRQLSIPSETIIEMLLELEPVCKELSYYWVQRGIANREIERFEEASNAFSEAADIRNNESFHIRHAQAKNYMQWGLWSLENQPSLAGDLFDVGKNQMKKLIEDAPGQYYAYSVHTYVDMLLRFHKKSNRPIDLDELALLLQRLLIEHNDKLNPQIAKTFLDFCGDNNKATRPINDLRSLYKSKFGRVNVVNDYTFDSDDLAE